MRGVRPNRSVFDGQTLPDLVDPLVQRVEPGVKASVLQVEDISGRQKSENPVVTFDVDDDLLGRMGPTATTMFHKTSIDFPPLRENDNPGILKTAQTYHAAPTAWRAAAAARSRVSGAGIGTAGPGTIAFRTGCVAIG